MLFTVPAPPRQTQNGLFSSQSTHHCHLSTHCTNILNDRSKEIILLADNYPACANGWGPGRQHSGSCADHCLPHLFFGSNQQHSEKLSQKKQHQKGCSLFQTTFPEHCHHSKKNSQQNSGADYVLNEVLTGDKQVKLCLALWKPMEALPLTWQMSHLLRMEERDVPTLMEEDLLAMVWKPSE